MSKRSAPAGEIDPGSSANSAGVPNARAVAEEWQKELELSEADLAAGKVVESVEVMRMLDERIAFMKAKKATPNR
jgi:hypothetical protein